MTPMSGVLRLSRKRFFKVDLAVPPPESAAAYLSWTPCAQNWRAAKARIAKQTAITRHPAGELTVPNARMIL